MKVTDHGLLFTERETTTLTNIGLKVEVFHLPLTDAIDEALAEHQGRPSKAFVEHLTAMKTGTPTAA